MIPILTSLSKVPLIFSKKRPSLLATWLLKRSADQRCCFSEEKAEETAGIQNKSTEQLSPFSSFSENPGNPGLFLEPESRGHAQGSLWGHTHPLHLRGIWWGPASFWVSLMGNGGGLEALRSVPITSSFM